MNMTQLKITAKGQVTLKQELLNHLGVKPGQKIEVEKSPHGGITVKSVQKQKSIKDFIGCLASHSPNSLTIDEMNTIINRAWAKQG